MSLDSAFFLLCFLPLAAALYYLIRGRRGGDVLLLILSLLFCAFGSLSGLGLLLAAALVNYIFGLLILRCPKRGKALAAAAVILDLAFLGAFKYLSFLLSLVLPLPETGWPGLGVAAPLGISFFTFKCISYIVDTRRDPACGTRSFFRLLLYISFFPQLTAGPITRFPEFCGQLGKRERRWEDLGQGLRRFVIGLGKKLILAAAAAKIADPVFSPGAPLSLSLGWLGALAYLMQIYFDFSGYSDMAIGLGRIFGFRTPENFLDPYTADSITDFWRRWHISLSLWFRDYLYIPLGGNRKGKVRTALNKFLVFLLCGFWHGAAWTFILWGAWHGLLSALESLRVLDTGRWKKTRLGAAACHVAGAARHVRGLPRLRRLRPGPADEPQPRERAAAHAVHPPLPALEKAVSQSIGDPCGRQAPAPGLWALPPAADRLPGAAGRGRVRPLHLCAVLGG